MEVEKLPNNVYMHTNYMNSTHIDICGNWELEELALGMVRELQKIEGANYFAGVYRIHKHFDLNSGECVVTRSENNELKATVEPFQKHFVPWLWRFNT